MAKLCIFSRTHVLFKDNGMQRLSTVYRTLSALLPIQATATSHIRPSRIRIRSSTTQRLSSHTAQATMGSLAEPEALHYPNVRRDDTVVDNYHHGVTIPDPYRWLENPDSDETQEFVREQQKLTESVLKTCETREKLKNKITEVFDYPKYECPFKKGGKYFYYHNTGLQAQSVLYIQDSLDAEAEVLLDPNSLSDDGTVALSFARFSEDAEYLAFGVSASGSDWVTIKVLHVPDKKMTTDVLSWVKFSGVEWTHDHKGFFYSRFPTPTTDVDAGTETDLNLNQQLYYHFLGTDQSEDILCWEDPEHPKWAFAGEVTDDGKYVLMYVGEGCDPSNRLYYCELSSLPQGLSGLKGLLPFNKLIDNFEAKYSLIANDGPVFTMLTNKNAPRNKIVRVDIGQPDVWTEVIPESPNDVLDSIVCVNKKQLLVSYLSDVKHILQVRDLETGTLLKQLPLDIGSVFTISGKRQDSEVFYSFMSFLSPGVIYRCDLSKEIPEPKVFRETLVKGFDRTLFETKQVFVTSKDGTKIPMFIVAKKDRMPGTSPSLLYGYGGFNISVTPSFSAARTVLMKNCGVVYASGNIRGGGEYGEEWHKAGSLANKQNCFDDFQACAEYLINNGYTEPAKLCIEGGSNGGLLVAACINQRPDLFGCALAHVGVMDMLRFHKFTIGHAWTTDYGCSEKPEEFDWLIKYSPLHNVRRPWESHSGVQYPATMLLTADHDDRVVPLHTLKLLATMQYVLIKSSEIKVQTNPIIGRIDTKAGHGTGRPTQKMIEEAADRFAFFVKMTGAAWTD